MGQSVINVFQLTLVSPIANVSISLIESMIDDDNMVRILQLVDVMPKELKRIT